MSPPLHVLHAQVTVVPTGIVFVAGLNALFVTEIPPAGTVVLPVGGPVVSPPPPHAAGETRASTIHSLFVVIAFSPWQDPLSISRPCFHAMNSHL